MDNSNFIEIQQFRHGKRLLIGSQRSEELVKTIRSKTFTKEEEG